MICVYIASPYTLGDKLSNVAVQQTAFDRLADAGLCPVAPLLLHYQHCFSNRKERDWIAFGLEYLRRSDCVVRLPGESRGAEGEIKEAGRIGIPVYYSLEQVIEESKYMYERKRHET